MGSRAQIEKASLCKGAALEVRCLLQLREHPLPAWKGLYSPPGLECTLQKDFYKVCESSGRAVACRMPQAFGSSSERGTPYWL